MRALAIAIVAMLATHAPPASAAYTCSVSADGSINFLTYDPLAPDATASGSVTLVCRHVSGGNNFVNWSMSLSNGSSGNCNARQMQRQTAPAATLSYNIFHNSTSAIWGSFSCGTPVSATAQINNGSPVFSTTQTMRGVLPAGQNVPSGTYLDTLVLTVSF